MTRWGIVSTIKAEKEDILRFAAHHIELGAHRLYLYLDRPDPEAFAILKAHPKIRVFTCDASHWHKLSKKRPVKHQTRQTANATHAYARPAEVDWLAHIDVDEFLWPSAPIDQLLSALPADCNCARVIPIESLIGDGTAFKARVPVGPDHDTIAVRLYPNYGHHLKGGFVSHVAGKLFVRTGLTDLTFKIHNAYQGKSKSPAAQVMKRIALCHVHARSWKHWIDLYRFRLRKGSYRAELAPARSPDSGGLTLHQLFTIIENEQGPEGLRTFFDEVCADTPERRHSLSREGLLHLCDLDLDAKLCRQFPEFDLTIPAKETNSR